MGPYYDPSNPSKSLYDQGVVVVAGGGGGCDQNTVTRTTTLFLKCNPAADTIRQVGAKQCTTPGCFDVSESALCQYAFAPMEWKGFCPMESQNPNLSSASVVKTSVCTTGVTGSKLSAQTTDPALFMSGFKACSCGPSRQCSSSLYECSCDASAKQCVTARVVSVTFSSGSEQEQSGTWATQPLNIKSMCVGPVWAPVTSANSGDALWQLTSGGRPGTASQVFLIPAQDGSSSLIAIGLVSFGANQTATCVSCS